MQAEKGGGNLIIRKMVLGSSRSRITVYSVCNDARETGAGPEEVIRVDDLELAALVLRYLRGDPLKDPDQDLAREALRSA